jgi:hypothetical protein
MSKPHSTLTQAIVKELLDYDPETGVLTWKPRLRNNPWNAKYAGKPAGSKQTNKNLKSYLGVAIFQKRHLAHRVIFLYCYGELPENDIDHINGNGLDNRLINLRKATRSENLKNQRKSYKNTSGVTGVSWHRASNKWRSTIKTLQKQFHLGAFDNFIDAVCARKSAEIMLGFHKNHGKSRSL